MAVRPTTEPDERSMPPVMITWVTPTAMMPMTVQPRISKTSAMPTRIRRILASTGSRRWRASCSAMAEGLAEVLLTAISVPPESELLRGKLHDADLSGFRAIENAGDAAFMHDQNAVAHAQHLRHFRRNHHHS